MRKLKNKAKVAAAPSRLDVHNEQLDKDMDDLTPGTFLVSTASRPASVSEYLIGCGLTECGLIDPFVLSAEALSFVEAVSQDATRMFQKEQEREESTLPFYIFSPHSKFRLRWDILSVALISCE